ncbi:hypothetical protein N7462_003128 [Penicillium macrosclerotiorum]|uniref:uncharacterized protein n=1 Tax=Penicillium macrosclerotiorum TaxID=303699 RepID=UPI0025468C60|nr:uncharacterized protein N7462_003128 [Penicillium macrosclerotiorum]KAJ5688736.1 hypothetical protein N7462_003128 [Penicillium macrosclerotiorum]
MPLKMDPEWRKAMEPFFANSAANPRPPITDPLEMRPVVEASLRNCLSVLPEYPDVEQEVHHITSYDGASIPVYRFWKKGDASKLGPAIVHAHGGGNILGDVQMHGTYLAQQIHQHGVQLFSVEFRLAPEHPFPTPVEDCYAALAWVNKHADQFAIDPHRIGVMGESGGGNLAAGMTLMARDRGLSPPVAKQFLIYPMLDDRNTGPCPALKDLLMWTPESSIVVWGTYLGANFGTDHVSQYAAPARAASVEGLPPTYMELSNLDIFRDEGLKYASRIAAANIEVEIHVYPGLPHGYDIFAPLCAPSQRAISDRVRAVSTL